MIHIKINDVLYPAAIVGCMEDKAWDKRASKSITLEIDYNTAIGLFVDGLVWSIVSTTDDDVVEEFDNSDYCVAGPLTDNRDGTMTAKMGKYTNEELLLMEVLS